MGELIAIEQLGLQYPEHLAVLRQYAPEIARLSDIENKRYNRDSKPLGMHVLFMVAIDVARARFAGEKVDIRSRAGHVVKPSEIIEAASALTVHYQLADTYPGIPENDYVRSYLEDEAAEAVVEVSDTLWNSMQIFLNNQQQGLPLIQPFVKNLQPVDLDLLLQVAVTKFTRRYEGNNGKNIEQENAEIRALLLRQHNQQIFDVLVNNRSNFPLILKTLAVEYRNLADSEHVRTDPDGVDLTVPDLLLDAQIGWE